MVIRKMNTVLVKHSRVMFGVFTGVIIISFVWFFTPGLSGSIFFADPTSPKAIVGNTFGKKISRGEMLDCARTMALAMAAGYGASPSTPVFRDYAIEAAFETLCKLDAASKMGIRISDSEVADYVKGMPVFRGPDGFDMKKFESYKKNRLEPAGYSGADLDEAVRQLLTLMAMDKQAAAEVIVTPDEVAQFQKGMNEKFDVRVFRFLAADFKDGVMLSEQELMSFHTANPQLFMLPPRMKAEVARFNYVDFEKEVVIPDALVKDYYDRNQAEFKKGDAVTPFAEAAPKIKAKLAEESSRALAMKAARKLRDELYDATSDISDGAGHLEAFRRMLKEKGIASYETGWFESSSETVKNIGKEPALIEALCKTSARYPISKSVAGNRAAFVALLVSREESRPGDFQDVKAKVEEKLKSLKSVSAAREAAADFALKADEAKDPASVLGSKGKFKVEKLAGFSPVKPPPSPDGDGILALASETPEGKLSKSRETSDGAFFIFVDKRLQPTADEAEKGRSEAESIYRMRKQMAAVDAMKMWIMANSQSFVAKKKGDKEGE